MSEEDPRAELTSIAASLRAHLEWQFATGASGLPAGGVAPGRSEVPRAPIEPARGADLHAAPPSAAPRAPEGAHPIAAAPPTPGEPPGASPGPDERVTRLALLSEEVRSCVRCVLHETRTQTVFARGNPFAELVFVGEGPGADEDAQGGPFVGKAGQLLDRMIVAMGYARDEVYICNIVKCRPPENRKPEQLELEACAPYLARQLELLQPKAIVALGATAVQGLVGTSEGITRLRGKWKLYKGRVPIMPTFHPAYLLRQPNAKREVWSDLQEVMRILGRTPKPAQ